MSSFVRRVLRERALASAVTQESESGSRMRFRCPNCQKAFVVKDELAGRRATCPGCHTSIVIPRPPAATASEGDGGGLRLVSEGQATDACPRCQGPRKPEWEVCPGCGLALTGGRCPVCGEPVDPQAGVCLDHPLKPLLSDPKSRFLICTNCGRKLNWGSRWCPICAVDAVLPQALRERSVADRVTALDARISSAKGDLRKEQAALGLMRILTFPFRFAWYLIARPLVGPVADYGYALRAKGLADGTAVGDLSARVVHLAKLRHELLMEVDERYAQRSRRMRIVKLVVLLLGALLSLAILGVFIAVLGRR